MPRVPVDSLASEFRKNPIKHADVVRIGQGSEGMSMKEAREKFQCGPETVRYYRKVYQKARSLLSTETVKKTVDGDRKLVTIQVPAKLLQKVRDQAQRIQFLEANLWRKTEEVETLKSELEGLKNGIQNTRASENGL